jgi:hypothetical protein
MNEGSVEDVLLRRLDMTDGLIDAYKEEYWKVARALAQGKGAEKSVEACRAEVEASGGVLPHAVALRELAAGETKDAGDSAVGADVVARAEQSSLASLSREMKERGAIAAFCGMHNTFFVRNHSVTLGRRDSDIDLTEEAQLLGCERSISRLQCRLFLDDTGWRLLNCGNRVMSVDGTTLKEGQEASIGPLALVSVSAVSLLFVPALG